ncbi:hypothetical protein M422DRAFT_263212 [Sphaerobolus stellatus SS14]|uniref:Uncharacterized protein n=1 Tax=Sphaerobolus stellatus (strain SS14) TaxID=990650 RepID=A0A0C9VAX3_SPHS4|nr:hypothetical protein M422DRAFT_263212 [Sphaerobolus stellatus SS14]
MHEAAPYWFNGLVPLAFQLQDQRLIGQVRSFLDYVLDHQQQDGWIGPELPTNSTIPRLVWPRYLVLFGLLQYAEADPTQTDRIVDAMHRFVSLAHDIWASGDEGNASMGFQFDYQNVRWEELIYSLQWLYDNYPQGNEDMLIETMQLVKASGFDWKNDYFTDAAFPKEAVTDMTMQNHGVNLAEALKSEALSYRFTHDETDIESTFKRLDLVYTYHGRPSGTFAADEHLAGLDPSRGTETCDIVEQIFSLATIYQMFGNNSVADRVEKLAYNALPAALMPDWWSRQYDSQVNQIWAKNLTSDLPWGDNSGYSGVFGLESNYPCCTVNHPQGYPKFWAHSFMKDEALNNLIHVFLGPAELATTLAGNNGVTVAVDTAYPFGSTLNYTITAAAPFTFSIRVPSYAQSRERSTIMIGNQRPSAIKPNNDSLYALQVKAGTTHFSVTLDMPLQVETVANGSVFVNRGPLNYAVEISYNDTSTLSWRNPQALSDTENLFPAVTPNYTTQFISQDRDHTLLPTVDWRIAIDPATIQVMDNSGRSGAEPWAAAAQPITLMAKACNIDWDILHNAAAPPPPSPNQCLGDIFDVTLIPFGAAKLRLGQIPTMKTSH